ncbi:unnamed protein product [Prunus armeniaca]
MVALLIVALDIGATVVVVVAATKVGAGTHSSINSNHGLPMAPLAPKVVGNISLIPPEVTTGSSNPQPPNGPTILHGTIGPNLSHRPHGSLSTTIDPRLLASWAPHAAPRTTLPNTLTQLVPTSSMALKLFLHLWGPYKDGLHLLSFPSASLIKHAFASIDSTAWHRRLEKTNLLIVPLNVCSLAAVLNIKVIAATAHATEAYTGYLPRLAAPSFHKLPAPSSFHKAFGTSILPQVVVPTPRHSTEDITYHLCNLHKHPLVLARLSTTDLASPPPIEPAMPPPAHLMRTSLLYYKWVICIKHHSDDTIERYKARLVTKGFHNAMALTTLRPSALLSNQPQFTLVSILLFPDDGFYGNSMSKMPSFKNTLHVHGLIISAPFSYPLVFQEVWQTLHFLSFSKDPTPSFSSFTSWALHLNQLKYVHDLLHKSNFLHAKPASIPLAGKFVLTASDVYLLASPTEYHELVGSLQYFTLTRPDISFAVNTVAQFMSSPRSPHMVSIKRILHYVKGTIDFGLHFTPQSPSTRLIVYSDADWAECPDSSHSTTGYLICLGSNLISWCPKKNWVLDCFSSSHALYNLNITYMAANTVFHARTRHIELDYHFVREKVALGSH